jgi:hypothetical protein
MISISLNSVKKADIFFKNVKESDINLLEIQQMNSVELCVFFRQKRLAP